METYIFKSSSESNIEILEIEDWQLLPIQNYEDNRYLSHLLKKY